MCPSSQRVAQRTESPHGAGIDPRLQGQPQELTALVDSDDIHCLMIGASGIGKTAFSCTPIWNMLAPPA